MSFTCTLFSDKGRCFNQSERALYGNFIKQKLLPSFPNPLDVTGASPFPPRSFLSLVCITYLSSARGGFQEQKPTTGSLLKDVTMALKTAQETSLRHI